MRRNTQRRWHRNGPDYETGYQMDGHDGIRRGPGALIWWMHNNTWNVSTWTRDREWSSKVNYRTLETAKRVAERWLKKYAA